MISEIESVEYYSFPVDNLEEEDVILVSSILQKIFSCLTIFCSRVIFYLLSEIPEWYTFSSRFYSQDKACL